MNSIEECLGPCLPYCNNNFNIYVYVIIGIIIGIFITYIKTSYYNNTNTKHNLPTQYT